MLNGYKQVVGSVGTWLLYVIIFLLPWQARFIFLPAYINGGYWEYGTLSIYAVDVLLAVTTMLAIGYTWGGALKRYTQLLLGVFLIIFFLFIINSITPYTLSALSGKFQIVAAMFLLLTMALLPWQKRHLQYALLGAGVWTSIFAVAQWFSGEVIGSTFFGMAAQLPSDLGVSVIETVSGRFLRAYGSLSHPNMLGGFLVVVILSSLNLLHYVERRISRSMIISGVFICSVSLCVTFSRAAFLGLIFGFLLLFILAVAKQKLFEYQKVFFVILGIVFLLSIQGVIYADIVAVRFSNSRLEQQSIEERIDSLNGVIPLFLERPFLGLGYHTYSQALFIRDREVRPVWVYQPVHNAFILLLVETGVLGFVMFMVVVSTTIAMRLKRIGEWEKATLIALLGSLVIISLFDHYLLSSHFGILLVVFSFMFFYEERQTIS